MKKKDIWTVELSNIETEEGVFDTRACINYESADAAIQAAKEMVNEYKNDKYVLEATVYGGEYEDENGNVLGEPYDIFTATNARPSVSIDARFSQRFTRLTVDYYATDPDVAWHYIDYHGEQLKTAVISSPFVRDEGSDIMLAEDCDLGVDDLVFGYVPGDWFNLKESEFVKRVYEAFL